MIDSPSTFSGARSRDELLRRFIAGVRRKDRHALASLAVNRAEFAYLVYPGSRMSRPPYNQPPDIEWMLLRANSDGGLTKLLARADQLRPLGYHCTSKSERDGAVTVWSGCLVRVRGDTGVRELRLFGSVVEYHGRYKFTSYGSDL